MLYLKLYSSFYFPAIKILPNDAGEFIIENSLFLDNKTKTTIVAKYGSIERNCDGIDQPRAWPTNCITVIPLNNKAPRGTLRGLQEAKTTNARAIQPFPAVIPSAQWGVKTKGKNEIKTSKDDKYSSDQTFESTADERRSLDGRDCGHTFKTC